MKNEIKKTSEVIKENVDMHAKLVEAFQNKDENAVAYWKLALERNLEQLKASK